MKSTSKQNLILGAAAVAIMVAIGWVSLRGTSEPTGEPTKIAALAADVLSPSIFDDPKARAAYQVAKDIPDVLEQLPCFCGCMSSFGHKNNLFCFKDRHGAGCEICEDIALDAKKMHDDGLPIAKIQDNIKAKYAKYQP